MISRSWIRQSHRWLGIALTLTIAANFVAMALGPPPVIIVYAPLPPLSLLILSGLYMFFQPYRVSSRHSVSQVNEQN
ncbi:hypothetical protein ABID21_001948 [Pseudorhizobium tarimense]|uniref:Transmembrane protein n=1 Tax=Pseudorhizobium tarimense TaxID=1079109 RepID=A0ABV2H5K3_9HYPH|nr:hypothetical protein [Pseudorhizobium tarimense]MCJ8519039.1 hypothetical protein [Pseudorhizobium tarimense]